MAEILRQEALRQTGYEITNESNGLLTINLLKKPSLEHYDPERIEVPTPENPRLVLGINGLERLTQAPIILPGKVVLRDRVNKAVPFGTFGGSLNIGGVTGGVSVEILSVGAPILDLRDRTSPDWSASATFEAQLAKRRTAFILKTTKEFGYTPNTAELEFYRELSEQSPTELLEGFLVETFTAIKAKQLPGDLYRPMQRFIQQHHACIEQLPQGGYIDDLALHRSIY